MNIFPLQHKKMQRLTLPYLRVGSCEMMNTATANHMDSFYVMNHKNRSAYQHPHRHHLPFLGDVVGGGIVDGYTGGEVSAHIASRLARALSLHTVVPAELKALRAEFPNEPLLEVMMASRSRAHALHAHSDAKTNTMNLLTEFDAQQYAMAADASFFAACKEQCKRPLSLFGASTEDSPAKTNDVRESGCRAIWFAASVMPSEASIDAPPSSGESQPAFGLDLLVSGVGSSRGFGIARGSSKRAPSPLQPRREVVVPLSCDHTPLRSEEYRRIVKAGGRVNFDAGNVLDDNPYMNVSRSFGHWSMKNNPKLSPVDQKMIPLPTSIRWAMEPGDVLVLCNHAISETRHTEESSVDELATVVARTLDAGKGPEEAAAALCDFALRFGADHSLQAMVAVATPSPPTPAEASMEVVPTEYDEWVDAGPMYVEAFRSKKYCAALQADCQRCGLSLAELLERRWRRVQPLLHQRHHLALLPYYSRECGILQQAMDEEAYLFDLPELKKDASALRKEDVCAVFTKMAAQLMNRTRGG